MKHQVFVYGTLKTGHYNNRALTMSKSSKLIFDDAFVKGQMYDLGPYPAVIQGNGMVKGEVWEIDQETLERLDHLEGHPSFYERFEVSLHGSEHFRVFIYFMPKSRLPGNAVPMPVGNWPQRSGAYARRK